jgi:hypothetical protein
MCNCIHIILYIFNIKTDTNHIENKGVSSPLHESFLENEYENADASTDEPPDYNTAIGNFKK